MFCFLAVAGLGLVSYVCVQVQTSVRKREGSCADSPGVSPEQFRKLSPPRDSQLAFGSEPTRLDETGVTSRDWERRHDGTLFFEAGDKNQPLCDWLFSLQNITGGAGIEHNCAICLDETVKLELQDFPSKRPPVPSITL